MDINFFIELNEIGKTQLLIWERKNKEEISWQTTDNSTIASHKILTFGFKDESKYYFKVKK
jgi:hypothetical protein